MPLLLYLDLEFKQFPLKSILVDSPTCLDKASLKNLLPQTEILVPLSPHDEESNVQGCGSPLLQTCSQSNALLISQIWTLKILQLRGMETLFHPSSSFELSLHSLGYVFHILIHIYHFFSAVLFCVSLLLAWDAVLSATRLASPGICIREHVLKFSSHSFQNLSSISSDASKPFFHIS